MTIKNTVGYIMDGTMEYIMGVGYSQSSVQCYRTAMRRIQGIFESLDDPYSPEIIADYIHNMSLQHDNGKATNSDIAPDAEKASWQNDKEMIRKLYCLD